MTRRVRYTRSLGVYVDPGLADQLRTLAQAERCSTAALVRRFLADAIVRWKTQSGSAVLHGGGGREGVDAQEERSPTA